MTRDGDLSEANSPQSVTVTLDDEIDITRGDMIVRPGNRPHVSREADAMIVWMSEQALVPGKQYWVKHTTRRTSGEVKACATQLTSTRCIARNAATLKLNEIGRCRVALHDPIMFDSYRRNRETGSFILVDRITHETVAAGMLLEPTTGQTTAEHWDDEPVGVRLQPAVSHISDDQREAGYGHKALHDTDHRPERFGQDDTCTRSGKAAV